MPPPLIILGASVRAAAQSAIRADFAPWCIDLFADRDLQAIAPVRRCPADRYPEAMVEMLADAPEGPVLFTGAMENHLAEVRAIAERRPLLGASPEAMEAVRLPETLATMKPATGLRVAQLRRSEPGHAWLTGRLLPRWQSRYWLAKPVRSAGGRGIHFWRARGGLDERRYLQQFVAGTPISAVYCADGWTSRWLGASEQIIGDPALGARPFQYAGSLAPAALGEPQRAALMRLGVGLTQRCDLRGLFGVDAVVDPRGAIWPVEVNPRYTASVEVLERAGLTPPAILTATAMVMPALLSDLAGASHPVAALSEGAEAAPRSAAGHVHGKTIVFARTAAVAPDLWENLSRDEVADVPAVGERFAAGEPVCTVLAEAATREACLERLHALADRVYTRLGP